MGARAGLAAILLAAGLALPGAGRTQTPPDIGRTQTMPDTGRTEALPDMGRTQTLPDEGPANGTRAAAPAEPGTPLATTETPPAAPGTAPVDTGAAPAASREIRLRVNQSVLIDSPVPIKRVSVTRPEIADVTVVSSKQMLVGGKSPGMTSLIYWSEGEAPFTADVVVEPYTEDILAGLRKIAPEETFDVTTSGDALFLTGTVRSETARNRLGEGAKVYVKNVVNLLRVERLEQVLLQVRVAEVDRSLAKELGFNAILQPVIDGETYRAAISPGNAFSPFFGDLRVPPGQVPGPNTTFNDLINLFVETPGPNPKFSGFLRLLHDRGALKMLAEPNLVVANGAEGRFLVGGEFPVVFNTTAGGTSSFSVVYKEFGVRLNFLPKITDNGEIHLKIAQEVSALDFANAVILTGFRIPALKSRRAESSLQLADGQTFVLAGLIDNKVSRQVSKIPLLGDIPILGALFRNTRFSNSETELMVMVTPKIVRPLAKDEIPALPTETMPPAEITPDLLP